MAILLAALLAGAFLWRRRSAARQAYGKVAGELLADPEDVDEPEEEDIDFSGKWEDDLDEPSGALSLAERVKLRLREMEQKVQ